MLVKFISGNGVALLVNTTHIPTEMESIIDSKMATISGVPPMFFVTFNDQAKFSFDQDGRLFMSWGRDKGYHPLGFTEHAVVMLVNKDTEQALTSPLYCHKCKSNSGKRKTITGSLNQQSPIRYQCDSCHLSWEIIPKSSRSQQAEQVQ